MANHTDHIAISLLIFVAIFLIAFFGHRHWEKHHKESDEFHGWRHQHYEDNPYNGQNYKCGAPPGRDGFTGDLYHWPTSGTFGNLSDTNPYGNYAGNIDMYYPTYSEGLFTDDYWTLT